MTALAGWQNFYVIVGSSAGALIGLQFVAISLINSSPEVPASAEGGSAFATPTVVHFATALGLSAVLCAPWEQMGGPALFWGAVGILGLVYATLVTRRMWRLTAYRAEFEDWLFHSVLPLAAYVVLVVSAWAATDSLAREALFGVAGSILLLLFVGIHNAWDAVTYHIFVRRNKARERG